MYVHVWVGAGVGVGVGVGVDVGVGVGVYRRDYEHYRQFRSAKGKCIRGMRMARSSHGDGGSGEEVNATHQTCVCNVSLHRGDQGQASRRWLRGRSGGNAMHCTGLD